MNKQVNETKNWQIALFALNGIASNTALSMIGYYMFFTQNILGLSAVVVGVIATAMRIFDGITDPPIGVLIDKTQTRFGKFRPYMLIGALITSLALIAIFYCPMNISITGKYMYTTIFYAIYIIGYTFQTTCTRAAQAVLTKDPKKRPLFAVYNSGFNAILGALMPLIIMTWLAPNYEGQLQSPLMWKHAVLIIAVMIISFAILAMIGIARCDRSENFGVLNKQVNVGFKDMWSVIRGNRALQMLIAAASTDKLALQLMNGVTIYIFSNCILNNELQGIYASIKVWPVLIVSMSGIYLARKFGLKKPFLIATWGSMLALIGMLLLGAKPDNYVLFLAMFILQACMVGITNNILNPMIADCADYEYYRSGKFIPGIVGTIFTFVDKIISSFATTIVGFALAFAGVAKNQVTTNTYISEKFYWTMMFCFCVVPIIGHICSIVAMKFYPLTTEKMIEIQEVIQERQKSA